MSGRRRRGASRSRSARRRRRSRAFWPDPADHPLFWSPTGQLHAISLVERATTQETWPVKEVTKQIGINLLGTIPWDPRGAAIYALGAPTARGDRTAYARAIGALLHSYSDVLNTRTYSTADNWEAQS